MEKNYIEIIKLNFFKDTNTSIRFGSINDGGYHLTPDRITEATILFSGGISSNVEFEYDIFRFNKNIAIFMVDPTVSRLKLLSKAILRSFLNKPEKLRYLINTLNFIYLLNTDRVFHINKWLSSENSILTIIKSKKQEFEGKKILLKLDIEGSEYDLLEEIVSNLDLFDCMIFEFHYLDVRSTELLNFLKKCSPKFSVIHLEINPSGGFDRNGLAKNIEITLERNA